MCARKYTEQVGGYLHGRDRTQEAMIQPFSLPLCAAQTEPTSCSIRHAAGQFNCSAKGFTVRNLSLSFSETLAQLLSKISDLQRSCNFPFATFRIAVLQCFLFQ